MNPTGRKTNVPRPQGKVAWHGAITSVQPRIRLLRSFDERNHSYLGYVLCLQGTIGDEARQFIVAVGEGAHAKHRFHVGDETSGQGTFVADSRKETAELYKASKLRVLNRPQRRRDGGLLSHRIPPSLAVYRERGHRRLSARTYDAICSTCMWGCRMPVEMVVDQWNPSQRRYRQEAFCYGPLSCPHYKPGPTRKAPGRKGMSWEEEDWVDQNAVSHRCPDD